MFLPAPMAGSRIRPALSHLFGSSPSIDSPTDIRFTPHYPAKSPLDDILRFATPGSDEYIVEEYASQIAALFDRWSPDLKGTHPAAAIPDLTSRDIEFSSFMAVRESPLRPGDPIEVFRKEFAQDLLRGRDHFLQNVRAFLAVFKEIKTADFEIYECTQTSKAPLTLEARIRYDLVGIVDKHAREERIGTWLTRWSRDETGDWRAVKWSPLEETSCRATGPIFVDISSAVFAHADSYRTQMLRGADYWRTVLDGAIGVDVYGNNGLAVGDFDNDGRDDLYVCQPAGLPNRLYHNRGDATFEDMTEKCGVGVLDFTACALFADFENRGVQDLLVVCATGPLLFRNDGHGKFTLKHDAFKFARPPQGAFTHAAIADYDGDGRLDIYFCLYNYYQGLDQYRYPVPYFDARNGPPNYLLHNEGEGTFRDRTEAAGLNAENDRYSFACSWGDANGDGWPDLYVVNDFGRNNLYRNNGDGTFAAVSSEAHVDEAGAGMSACWLDFDNDGNQDIYAAGMWVAAGMRVFEDSQFHSGEPAKVRDLYRRHMSGNSLYRNLGSENFQNVGNKAGVEMGRWSWSTDSWDFDHDGYPDIYVANGYISGLEQRDVSSFFWRQVVAKSPSASTPSSEYERGWGAMNELIRSDATWNGHERNVFFANNRDGTFSDVSGVVGLDLRDDSRAFALADLDGDGRLEIVLKNRNAPQARVLRLAMESIGNSVMLRLRGHKSNRDAIGARVTVQSGSLRQTKYLQAGSGFLSQHTKELSFGVGRSSDPVSVTVRWPSGVSEVFEKVPINHRVELEEGVRDFRVKPFEPTPRAWEEANPRTSGESLPDSIGTWLIELIKAPDFALPDLSGNLRTLESFRGKVVLLNFFTSRCESCVEQLRLLRSSRVTGTKVVAINIDDPLDARAVKTLATNESLTFPILLSTPEIASAYNIVYRYLFDRHRNLPLPASFLLDETGNIAKVYQGKLTAEQLSDDAPAIPRSDSDRLLRALPFAGTLVQDTFRRNLFTYGVAFFQHGFLDEADHSFKQVIAAKPDDPDAHYNLGTLCLRRNSFVEAKQYLEKAVELRPDYPEAWNNLGMLAAQQGHDEEAITAFQRSLNFRPNYATALLNLGNVYRRQGNLDEAEKYLANALASEPSNAEVSYNLGMLYARRNQTDRAAQYLQDAIRLRPDYADALNNLGVLYVQARRYTEAEAMFKECIREAPDFDQAYLNLARVYLISNEKDKARSTLQALLQKQPQHKMAQQMLQMLY